MAAERAPDALGASAVAVIPARAGSKGLPGKHLLSLGGRPLIAWTIEAALAATRIGTVIVTSDDEEILRVARDQGATALSRPAHLATDTARSEPVVAHALESCGDGAAWTILLQPTSPLRTGADIDAAMALLDGSNAQAVISVVVPEYSPWKCFYQDDAGHLRGVVSDDAPFRPRQEHPRPLRPNGAIYGVETAFFLAEERFFASKTLPYLMGEDASIDIDTLRDLARAEAVLRSRC